jgi:hypothetical protein
MVPSMGLTIGDTSYYAGVNVYLFPGDLAKVGESKPPRKDEQAEYL